MEERRESIPSVGRRLRELRKDIKRTLKEQSEIFGVSLNSVYRWEHDLAMPKRTLLREIAAHHGVTYEWLLNGVSAEKEATQGKAANLNMNTEKQLLKMFRNLSGNNKFKVIGYVEHICIEDLGEKIGSTYSESQYTNTDNIF